MAMWVLSTASHVSAVCTIGATAVMFPVRLSAAKQSPWDLNSLLQFPIRERVDGQQINRRYEQVVFPDEVHSHLVVTALMCMSSWTARREFISIQGLHRRVLDLATSETHVPIAAAAAFCWSCARRISLPSPVFLYDASYDVRRHAEFELFNIEEKLQWCRDHSCRLGIMLFTLTKLLMHHNDLETISEEDLSITLNEMALCMFGPDFGVSGPSFEMYGHLITAVHMLVGLGNKDCRQVDC